jgi:hypothetical protein
MTDNEYFALPNLSYSKLAALDRIGPSLFIENENTKDNKAITIGSLVDDILTNPNDITDKYYITTMSKPTASLGVLVDACIESFKTLEEITIEKVVHLAKGLLLWKSTTNEETYIRKFDNSIFWDYLKSHYHSNGKIVISHATMELAKTMAKTLVEDIDTKDAFLTEPEVEVIYQHVQTWGENEDTNDFFGSTNPFVGYRCKFDILRINHKDKTLQFIDIKTMEDKASTFERSFWMFRYYIQDALYQDGLKNLRDTTYPDYELLDPYNIVVSQSEPEKAYKFNIDPKWLQAGREGFILGYKKFKGYEELTTEYLWHMETKVYNYSKDEFYNGRVKSIPFNGKIE